MKVNNAIEITKHFQANVKFDADSKEFFYLIIPWLCKQVYEEIIKIKDQNKFKKIIPNEDFLKIEHIPYLYGRFDINFYPIIWSAAGANPLFGTYTHELMAQFVGEGK